MHQCVLTGGIANSRVDLYSAAFPVPVRFDLSGSTIEIGGVGNAGACAIDNIKPLLIPDIGYVCIRPMGGCPNGPRYCGPGAPGSGPPLGVDALSDGDIGPCTGNADCAAQCSASCPLEYGAGFAMSSSGCTGHCTVDDGVCTADAQCASAGAGLCNGPENPPISMINVCQCSCLDAASFGGSNPGDTQCYLGADLSIENTIPCNGTDVLIAIGTTCLPFTTQRAHGRIDDANLIPGSIIPAPPQSPDANDQTGSPLACSTVDSSTTTGLVAVGAANLFGSLFGGDQSVALRATCQ
jgi:hypothetical protein